MMIAHIGEFSLEYVVNSSAVLPWIEEKKKIIQYTKSIQYQTRQEWQKKFESVGFDLLATYDYDLNKTTNPQRLFYAVYKRNDKPCEPVIDKPVKWKGVKRQQLFSFRFFVSFSSVRFVCVDEIKWTILVNWLADRKGRMKHEDRLTALLSGHR